MSWEPSRGELLAAIAERRSPRAFAERPVDDADLALLFEAARWAPSSNNLQPWRFVLTRRGTEPFEALAATLRPGNAWATRAPVLLLCAAREMLIHPRKPPKPNRRALLELGLAVGNLLTQASAAGLAAHPMGGFDPEAAGEAVGVEEGFEVGVLVALGHPGDPETLEPDLREKELRARDRKPLRELAFEGRWGAPAPFASEAPADDEA